MYHRAVVHRPPGPVSRLRASPHPRPIIVEGSVGTVYRCLSLSCGHYVEMVLCGVKRYFPIRHLLRVQVYAAELCTEGLPASISGRSRFLFKLRGGYGMLIA